MRNTLYRQMVFWIDAHRTWIEVVDDNLYKEHIIVRHDRTDYIVSRTLVLRAFKEKTVHTPKVRHGLSRSMNWTRHWLSTVNRTGEFSRRIKKAAMYLLSGDTEVIIRLATHGIVRLNLVVPAAHIPEKPYYL